MFPRVTRAVSVSSPLPAARCPLSPLPLPLLLLLLQLQYRVSKRTVSASMVGRRGTGGEAQLRCRFPGRRGVSEKRRERRSTAINRVH